MKLYLVILLTAVIAFGSFMVYSQTHQHHRPCYATTISRCP